MLNAIKLAIESLGFQIVPNRSTDVEIAFICPEPRCGDKSGNRSVNLLTGKTNCWRCGSGHGGDFYKWAKHLGYEINPDLIEVHNDDYEQTLRELNKATKVTPTYVTEIDLPKGFVPLSEESDCAYGRAIERMAKRKNLTLESFVKAGVGFTRDDSLWEPYAIFPVAEWGKVVYYQGRTYSKSREGGVTKRFPSRDKVPNGARHWVYDIERLRKPSAKICIIVESILNVLSLKEELRNRGVKGIVPVCIFKHAISKEQAKKLSVIRGIDEFALMFDPDATKDAWASALRSVIPPHKFSVVYMPKGVDANDDAKIAVDQFLKRKRVLGDSRSNLGNDGLLSECEFMASHLEA